MAKRSYWERRKNSVYLHVTQRVCAKFAPRPDSVLDVGSNGTPTLEWHRSSAARLVSLDLRRPYVADGVESITDNFLKYQPRERYDLVTCLQVLEHVPDASKFAQHLLSVGKIVVVSVPYKWRKGLCKEHVHDPVDRFKMYRWFRRWPTYSYIAREVHPERSRLIQVYHSDVTLTKELDEYGRLLFKRIRREAGRLYRKHAGRAGSNTPITAGRR